MRRKGSRAGSVSLAQIAAVTALVQRTTGVDITVVSETTDDGRYVFRGLGAAPELGLRAGRAIPYEASLCSRIHAGESPAT